MTDATKPTRLSRQRLIGPGVILLAAWAYALAGQDVHPESRRIPVEVIVNPPAARNLWGASAAWLTQNFEVTGGYVDITNTSTLPFNSARFYGEYYDDDGRLCFTLAFTQDNNVGGLKGQFWPGETRTLMEAAQMAPAVRPKEVRLWFLGEAGESQSHPETLIPVTIRDGTIGRVEGIRLSKQKDQPLSPIALVEANSDTYGLPTSIKVNAAQDEVARQWAGELVSKLRFAPATRDGQRISATTLILIRALQLDPQVAIPAAVAADDPWIRAYLAANKGNSVLPFVNLLRLQREEGADLFRYFSIGTDWCLSVFRWVPDPIAGGTRREWRPPDNPE